MINLLNNVLKIVLQILVKFGIKKAAQAQLKKAMEEYFRDHYGNVANTGELRENEKRARDRLKKRLESSANLLFSNFGGIPMGEKKKKLSLEISPDKLTLIGDLDQDGRRSFDVNVYSSEGLDEIIGLVKGVWKK